MSSMYDDDYDPFNKPKREPSVTQVSLPDLNTLVQPMSSLVIKRALTTGEYSYELKMYFATPEEAISPETLAMTKEFDEHFYRVFPKPIRAEKPEKSEKSRRASGGESDSAL